VGVGVLHAVRRSPLRQSPRRSSFTRGATSVPSSPTLAITTPARSGDARVGTKNMPHERQQQRAAGKEARQTQEQCPPRAAVGVREVSCKYGTAIVGTLNTSVAGSGGGMALGRCGRDMDAHPLGASDALLILAVAAWEALARTEGELGRQGCCVVFTGGVDARWVAPLPRAARLSSWACRARRFSPTTTPMGSLVVRERACLICGTRCHPT
jgi:hypothetical protein